MKIIDRRKERLGFVDSVDPSSHFHLLFNQLEEVLFFVKDTDGRLWVGNRALLDRYDLADESELWGRTDFDFLPDSMAQKFRADDVKVVASGEAMLDILEIYPDATGVPSWFMTNKLPVRSRSGKVIGVMGMIQSYNTTPGIQPRLKNIAPALAHLREHFAEEVTMPKLAEMSGLSLRQFERKFKALMRTTPQQFLMRRRVHAACDLLRETNDNIGDVALRCGFYDQSSFTRLFKRHISMTPLQYRKRYR